MKLTELSQVREPLDLPFTLVRIQVLLNFGPLRKSLIFLDLPETVVHAGESFQNKAQGTSSLHIGGGSRFLMHTEVSDLPERHKASIVVYFTAHIDKPVLKLSQICKGRFICIVFSLVDEPIQILVQFHLLEASVQFELGHGALV